MALWRSPGRGSPDHFGGLPYVWMFGTWAGGWHNRLTTHRPSGRTPEYGTAKMVEGLRMRLGWHIDAFSVFPVDKGWDIQVNEFDFRDNGGIVYEEDGVKVTHWQRSHAKDGASAYRLDWNGLRFVWTGDGRTSKIDAKYAKGCDVYATEPQPELVGDWPVEGDLVVPMEQLPEILRESMGAEWRLRQKNR